MRGLILDLSLYGTQDAHFVGAFAKTGNTGQIKICLPGRPDFAAS